MNFKTCKALALLFILHNVRLQVSKPFLPHGKGSIYITQCKITRKSYYSKFNSNFDIYITQCKITGYKEQLEYFQNLNLYYTM